MTSRDDATAAARPSALSELQRIVLPVSVAVLVAACAGVALQLPGNPADVVAGSVAALAVATACVVYIFLPRPESAAADTAALVVAGLAGTAVAAMLPNTPGFVIIFLAVAALGMRMPLRPALLAALVVFAAMNAAFAAAGRLSVADLASQNIGAAFLFSTGAFVRSARVAQEQARTAQARAEDLLSQLQVSEAARAEAVALTERSRLAREIHDILAHALSGLVLSLDTMELLGRQAGTEPAALDELLGQVTRARRIARDGLADTKRAVAALRGDELPGPGLLDQLVRDAAAATGIRAEFAVAGRPRPLPPETGLALYRTAQEALTNSAKYAGPGARVELRLTYAEDAVELAVDDIRPAGSPATAAGLTFGGYGLTGMRERAELLGGSLIAGPTSSGFGLRLSLPTVPATALTADPRGEPS